MRVRWVIAFWVAVVAGCGARTGLDVPLHHDAGPDVAFHHEAGVDVIEEDAPEFPPLDAAKHDVDKTGCPPLTFIYAVATNDWLLRFDPPSATFTQIAQLFCPAAGSHPFSMAVDRKNTAYVEYDNGMIFAVDTSTGACATTPYVADSVLPFGNFGMGYATIGFGPDEQLFVSANTPGTLGRIDTLNAFTLLPVGEFQPAVPWAELTGSGDGRLYAFYGITNDSDTAIAEIDKTTGSVIGQDPLPDVHRGSGWAFAYWGDGFYIFTDPGPQNTWHYDTTTKQATIVAHYTTAVVGAGVSTCAPQ
ncbi:MAG TPA: hypothetical protein VH054_00480 [Polyangiaceae bacterium]|nr:hypothetical protein [Polyangiaceae bacterium]